MRMTMESLREELLALEPGNWLHISDAVAQQWLDRNGLKVEVAWRLQFYQSLPRKLAVFPGPGYVTVVRLHPAFASQAGYFEADLTQAMPIPCFMAEVPGDKQSVCGGRNAARRMVATKKHHPGAKQFPTRDDVIPLV